MADLAHRSIPGWLDRPGTGEWLAELEESVQHAERWKYTPAARIREIIEQSWPEPVSSHAPDEAAVELIRATDSPVAFMGVCAAGGVEVLEVAESSEHPLDCSAISVPTVIRVAPNVSIELRESSYAPVQLMWIVLSEGSRVIHTRQFFTNEPAQWQYLHVTQWGSSSYTLHNHTLGATLRRQDLHVELLGQGAELKLHSAAYVADGLHLDQQITVEHVAGHTVSRQKVHNIGGDKATVVCNGRIHIHRNAPKSDAELSNRNLALGDNTTINSKPELEIYTDDVKCAHGATVGRLADDELYYCTSRGIDPAEARRLLSKGFLLEGIDGPCADDAVKRFSEALR